MANHPSAAKRNRQNRVRKARNFAVRSQMRSAIKAAREAIADKGDNRAELVKIAVRSIYTAKSKNVIKPSAASRHVSRLMRHTQ